MSFLPTFSRLFLSGLFTFYIFTSLFARALSRCSAASLLFSTLWWPIAWYLYGALPKTGLRLVLIPAEPV